MLVSLPQGFTGQAAAFGEGDQRDGEDNGGTETHTGQVLGAGEGQQEVDGADTRGQEGDYQAEGRAAQQ